MAPPATIDELLLAAHDQVWAWVRSVPAGSARRSSLPWAARYEVLAAWAGIAAGADRALGEISHSADYTEMVRPLRGQLARVATRAAVRPSTPEPHLVRVGELIGAAADLLATPEYNSLGVDLQDATVTRDRVTCLVEATARLTAARLQTERPRPPRSLLQAKPWLSLAAAAHAVTTDPAANARSARPQVQVPRIREDSLTGAVDRWRLAAAEAAEKSPNPPADLPRVATGLALIYEAAHRAGVPDTSAKAEEWRAARSWPRHVRLLAPAAAGLREATLELRTALSEALRDDDPDHLRQSLAGVLLHAPTLGHGYAQTITAVVQAEIPVVAVRPFLETERQGGPFDRGDFGWSVGTAADDARLALAQAAQRGQWMPLPATSATAAAILSATQQAGQPDDAGERSLQLASERLRAAGRHLDRGRQVLEDLTDRSVHSDRDGPREPPAAGLSR